MTVIDITDRINYKTDSDKQELLSATIKVCYPVGHVFRQTDTVLKFSGRLDQLDKKMRILNEKIKELIDES